MIKIKLKEVFLYSILPLITAFLIFLLIFYCKAAEFNSYIHPLGRYILTGLAFAVIIFSGIILLLHLSAVICRHFGYDYMKKNSKGQILLMVVFLIAGLAYILLLHSFSEHLNQMEVKEIGHNGMMQTFVITQVERVPGKNARYDYHLSVNARDGKTYDITTSRKINSMDLGDGVTIKYLPENPTVFRELDAKGFIIDK